MTLAEQRVIDLKALDRADDARKEEKIAKRLYPQRLFDDYLISDTGLVYSFTFWRGKLIREIKPDPDKKGYLRVRLTVNGKRRPFRVHRLVAKEYLPPRPTPQHELRHLNGNKQDNRAVNLAWGMAQDNADDREKHGRTSRGIRHSRAIKRGLVGVTHWKRRAKKENGQ